jgi:transcriptional regulator with XRE-family HTH domain
MPGATSPSLEGRGGEVYRKWAIYRWTQEKIAQEYGISQQRVGQIIAAVRTQLPKTDRSELIEQSRAFLEDVQRRFLEIAELTPAPLVAGKDGLPVADPETGEYVRDYSARMKALAEARITDEQIAKRFGLSEPAKTSVDLQATVRYEIAGVDEGDLT